MIEQTIRIIDPLIKCPTCKAETSIIMWNIKSVEKGTSYECPICHKKTTKEELGL